MNDKCQNCPLRGTDDVCPGQSNPRVCARSTNPDVAAEILAYPSLFQQAKNLTKAVVGHMKNGFEMTTDEERERRLSICRACPHFDAEQTRCRKCGCFLTYSGKLALASEKCPEGHW